MTIGHLPADTKLIRVRGPLANSSTDVNTYTVYIRPFYDEANNIGQVTLFSQPNTVYTLNGHTYVGNAGLDALSVLSAGSTMTAGFTTFQPDYNPLNGAYAGRFNLQYVVAGSTLEDNYTEGISGDVIARNGNMLTLRGSTLILTTADTLLPYRRRRYRRHVLLGPGTIVTADDNPLLTNLTPSSIAVGDHITARGILPAAYAPRRPASVTRLHRHHQHQHRLGAAAAERSVRHAGLLGGGKSGDGREHHRQLSGRQPSILPATATPTPVAAAFSVDTEGLTLPAGHGARRSDLAERLRDAFRNRAARFPGVRTQQSRRRCRSPAARSGAVSRRPRARGLRRRQPGMRTRGHAGDLELAGHRDAVLGHHR